MEARHAHTRSRCSGPTAGRTPGSGGGWFEGGALRQLTAFQVMPERDQQLARQRDDADFMESRAAGAEALLVPLAEGAVGLKAQPAPGDLDRHGPHQGVAGLADTLFMILAAALKGRGRQPGQRADLAAVMEVAPAEELHDVEPGGVLADALEPQQLAHLDHAGVLRLADRGAAFRFQVQDLALHELPAGELALQPRGQPAGKGLPSQRCNWGRRVRKSLSTLRWMPWLTSRPLMRFT